MKICAILTLVAVLTLAYGNPAFGYPVTVEIEGVVTDVVTYGDLDGFEFDGSVTAGSTIMTGSFIYDSETPGQSAGGYAIAYWLNSISMSVGNYTFTHNPETTHGPFFIIEVEPGQFRYKIRSFSPLFYGPCYLNGEPTNLEDIVYPPSCGISLYLKADTESPIGDALPDENTFPALSTFTEARFGAGSDGGITFGIGGEITSITVIPEPTSVLLFGFGGFALLRRGYAGQALLRKRRR